MSLDGLPNLRLPEAPGIRNAPTLRHQPDDAETPHAQFHLPTTASARIARSTLGRRNSSQRRHADRPRATIHRRDLLGGLIHEYHEPPHEHEY